MTVGEEALGSQAGAQRGASACVYFSLFGSGYAGLGDTALGREDGLYQFAFSMSIKELLC